MERLYVQKIKLETEKELKIYETQVKKVPTEMTKNDEVVNNLLLNYQSLHCQNLMEIYLNDKSLGIPLKQQSITINQFKMLSNSTTYEHNYVTKQRTLSLA